MIKFKNKIKNCYLIVNAKLSLGDVIDVKELDFFTRKYLRGFLKPRMVKNSQIEYTGPVGISLFEYLKRPVTKHDFFLIMEQIIVTIQKIWSNNLFLSKLVLDAQNIYINEVTKEVQFIYIPLMTPPSAPNVLLFLQSIIYLAKPAPENDTGYLSRFLYFLQGMPMFEVTKIENYIAGEDRNVVNIIRTHNTSQSGFMTNKQQHYYEHYDNKSTPPPAADPTSLLQDEDATGLLQEEDATGLLQEEEETGLLQEEEETGLLVEQTVYQPHYPTLCRVLTGETVNINKPVYRIGKERSYVDFFVANNSTISRSHADIISRNNRYFVVDLNSKNRTFVNNRVLIPQCETEIFDGDMLKLANEDFRFRVE